ncbi:Glycosyl transferase, family 2 [hydrothermal vent metagenome]|uniref:Glycosyl transferase, family 2 n=1 Tax=hydrothermal vent metagenome TaxID=652676 RepID=A0A3B0R0D8_9ZZZZ
MANKNKNTNADRPLVSVITPSYNQGAFIRETIESVHSQNYPRIEHIIFDGGSTDDSIDIIKEYEDKLSWTSEKDQGQSDAINKGFRKATGDIVAWLNSDDTYLDDALNKAVTFLEQNPDVMMVYGKGYTIDKDSRITGECHTEPFNMKRLESFNFIYQPSVFIRREVFEEIGFLDESLHYSMDLDLWIRVAKKFKIAYLPEFLSTYRLHGDSKTMSQGVAFNKEEMETFKRHFGRAPINWVYGYIHALTAARFPFLKKSKFLFFSVMLPYFIYKYAMINKSLPWGIFSVMGTEGFKKFKKSWDELR